MSLVSAILLEKATLTSLHCLRMSLAVCCSKPSTTDRNSTEDCISRSAFSIFAWEKSCHSSGVTELEKKRRFFFKFSPSFFFYSHQVIFSLPSISCLILELLAVTVFEISSFLCQNLQRAISQKHIQHAWIASSR